MVSFGFLFRGQHEQDVGILSSSEVFGEEIVLDVLIGCIHDVFRIKNGKYLCSVTCWSSSIKVLELSRDVLSQRWCLGPPLT
jgi:hypothetical protein